MRKRKRGVVLAVVLAAGVMLLMIGATTFVTFGQEDESTLPEIPGITVDDVRVNGCVDCHAQVDAERDYRLTVKTEEWVEGVPAEFLEIAQAAAPSGVTLKGKHPNVGTVITSVPKDCLVCHAKEVAESIEAPPFASLLHLIHLVGGEENHFISSYGGECTHCHALNKETGEWTIKSGKEQ